MIRLIQRRLIIPRGDTGSFSIPVLSKGVTNNIAVFTIFDEVTHTKMFQKMVPSEGDVINIAFTHSDTVNLKPGKYVWDIKYYSNPEFVDEELVNGEEIDSYYAGFSLPVCEIRETADNYLVSPEAPTATLSPQQLEIVTGAIHSLNEAIRKTQENVEHYPEIRNEVWYVWDAELGDYVSTDVRANGIVGNGIASAVLNNDYTLTLNFTDGTSFTSPSIRGQRGNGIDDIVLNNDFTLTISYTDGDSYVTPSIRGPIGLTPQFSIGTVQDGAVAAASITGTAENPVLNLTLPNAHVPTRVSQLENDSGYLTQEVDPTVPQWAKEPTKPSYTPQEVGALPADTYIPQKTSDLTNDSNYAIDANYVHTDNNYTTAEKNKLSSIAADAEVNVNADWNANSGDAQILNKPTKVSDFTNDAGYLTEHQDISGKADKSEIPTKVSQLQNDSGYLTSYTETDPTVPAWAKAAQKPTYTASEVGAPTVAEMNTAIGTAIGQINSFDMAVVQVLPTQDISTHTIYLVPKTGETNDVYDEYVYINNTWEMVGNTQIDLSDYALKSELPTKVSDLTDDSGHYTKPATGIPASDLADGVIPDAPVQDVQVNGVSVLQDGVANVPIADAQNKLGLVKVDTSYGLNVYNNGLLRIWGASDADMKNGVNQSKAIIPEKQHVAAFYGLAKAAGADMKDIANTTVGTYPDAQKEAIQSMLGISQMLAPTNPNLVATQAYSIGDVFAANGHLYKATAAIAQDEAIIPETNCVETTMVDAGGKIKDVQINGASIVESGVANISKASTTTLGVVMANTGYGTSINNAGAIIIQNATEAHLKGSTGSYRPITPSQQHISTFYGLSKVAGVDLANETVTLGTYPETSKTAIRTMIGAASSNVIAVQDTQPTDTDTKIWLPETAETPIQVPTVAEMNAALNEKVDDVQVNGVSIVQNGVANVPIASSNTFGVVKVANQGVGLNSNNILQIVPASLKTVKDGIQNYNPIVPSHQHESTFYGLAKAAGDTTQSQSDNAVGTYTDEALAKIQKMLGLYQRGELIADFTTTEDSASVTVNTDLNGQPFELWRVKIIVHLKALTTGTTSYYLSNLFVTTEGNNAQNVYYGLPTLRQNDASKSTFFFDFETFGNYMVRSFATNNTAGFDQSTNGVISYYQNISPKCITGFSINRYSATTSLVPAGTQILIYGTRI